MTPYSETKGKPFIDWNARLKTPKNQITEEMWKEWEADAAGWITCACGNLCDALPRDRDGEPTDQFLADFGYEFFFAIQEKNLREARETLSKIEARSTELLKEMGVI
jgi:hypothetical protein